MSLAGQGLAYLPAPLPAGERTSHAPCDSSSPPLLPPCPYSSLLSLPVLSPSPPFLILLLALLSLSPSPGCASLGWLRGDVVVRMGRRD